MKKLSKEEQLKKIIHKAKKNGWETNIISINPGYESDMIFDHDFLKSYFGKEEAYAFGKPIGKKVWEIEVQQLVLEKDRLAHLVKFL